MLTPEALGSFLTPLSSHNKDNFYAFISAYMNSWDLRVPNSPYQIDYLPEILWKYFRNGIAHGFAIRRGGIYNEADPTKWRVVESRLEIGPNAFFKDFSTGVASFFLEVNTIHRASFLRRFQEVYPH